jgi:hypothetical protein
MNAELEREMENHGWSKLYNSQGIRRLEFLLH